MSVLLTILMLIVWPVIFGIIGSRWYKFRYNKRVKVEKELALKKGSEYEKEYYDSSLTVTCLAFIGLVAWLVIGGIIGSTVLPMEKTYDIEKCYPIKTQDNTVIYSIFDISDGTYNYLTDSDDEGVKIMDWVSVNAPFYSTSITFDSTEPRYEVTQYRFKYFWCYLVGVNFKCWENKHIIHLPNENSVIYTTTVDED